MACRLATDLGGPSWWPCWAWPMERWNFEMFPWWRQWDVWALKPHLKENMCWIHFQHYGSGRCGTGEWMCDEYECYGCVVDLWGICMAGTVLSRWCLGRMMEDIGVFCKILENRSIGIWVEINADFPVNNGMASGYPCPVGMQIFHWSFPTRRWSSSKIVYIRSAIAACAFTCCASTSDCWTKRFPSKWSCWLLDFNEKFPILIANALCSHCRTCVLDSRSCFSYRVSCKPHTCDFLSTLRRSFQKASERSTRRPAMEILVFSFSL